MDWSSKESLGIVVEVLEQVSYMDRKLCLEYI